MGCFDHWGYSGFLKIEKTTIDETVNYCAGGNNYNQEHKNDHDNHDTENDHDNHDAENDHDQDYDYHDHEKDHGHDQDYGWCATLFDHGLYALDGWSLELTETNSADLSDPYDNAASSIQVSPGCIFKGYQEKSKVGLLQEITEDIPRFGPLNINDQLSSYSCTCYDEHDQDHQYENEHDQDQEEGTTVEYPLEEY